MQAAIAMRRVATLAAHQPLCAAILTRATAGRRPSLAAAMLATNRCAWFSATLATSAPASPAAFLPPPILFVTGGPGSGKGTQCGHLVRRFAADVRGEDGEPNDAAAPVTATEAKRNFGLAHISVGALLRRAAMPSSADSPSSSGASAVSSLSASDRSLVVSTLAAGGILPGRLTVQLLLGEFSRLVTAQAAANPAVRLALLVDGFPRTLDNVHEFERALGAGAIHSVLLLEADEQQMRDRLAKRGRSDDAPAIVQRRIEGFAKQTMPVVDWFASQVRAAAEQPATNASSAFSAATTAATSPSASAATSSTSPRLFVVDGRPSIEAVWLDVRRAFAEFARLRLDVDIDSAASSHAAAQANEKRK